MNRREAIKTGIAFAVGAAVPIVATAEEPLAFKLTNHTEGEKAINLYGFNATKKEGGRWTWALEFSVPDMNTGSQVYEFDRQFKIGVSQGPEAIVKIQDATLTIRWDAGFSIDYDANEGTVVVDRFNSPPVVNTTAPIQNFEIDWYK